MALDPSPEMNRTKSEVPLQLTTKMSTFSVEYLHFVGALKLVCGALKLVCGALKLVC